VNSFNSQHEIEYIKTKMIKDVSAEPAASATPAAVVATRWMRDLDEQETPVIPPCCMDEIAENEDDQKDGAKLLFESGVATVIASDDAGGTDCSEDEDEDDDASFTLSEKDDGAFISDRSEGFVVKEDEDLTSDTSDVCVPN
jgi:hypothetical protein